MRIAWLIVITISFAYAGWIISTAFDEWRESPVITTIDSTTVPIEDIPFPSGTITFQKIGSKKV